MTNVEINRPKVGVGVFVRNSSGKFLALKRRGAHGSGTWGLPGGHLEFGESPEQTAVREVLEETGCAITNVRFAGLTNDPMPLENKHYITIFMESDLVQGQVPRIMEPDKMELLDWFDLENQPTPLFIPLKNFLEGKRYP